MATVHHRDGEGFEAAAGYARAVRRGSRIEVSGTTVPGDGLGGPEETGRQARAALLRALEAVRALGGDAADVVRSRLFLAPTADWRSAADAHAEILGAVAPANTTLLVAALLGEGSVVEVELEAELESDQAGAGDAPADRDGRGAGARTGTGG
jgi:enamine deaminase RidA (YjgF/YER057c/UK114 family)